MTGFLRNRQSKNNIKRFELKVCNDWINHEKSDALMWHSWIVLSGAPVWYSLFCVL